MSEKATADTVQKVKVVLLEDEKQLQGFLAGWIRDHFKQVDLAVFENGDDAWRELFRVPADLFVTDELHPGMMGNEIVGKLAAQKVECPVLWTSTSSLSQLPESYAGQWLKVEILPKPFSREQFQEKIILLMGADGGIGDENRPPVRG